MRRPYNATPPGKLGEYLIGDLGTARRHLERLLRDCRPADIAVLVEVQNSIEACVARIERDLKIAPNG